MSLSPNVAKVQPSVTLEITAKAKALKAKGIDVISLSAGEPDFDTPKHICDAAVEAIRSGFTRYTPASGTAELKQAVCDKFKRDNGLTYDPAQVIINCGAKHSDFLAIFAVTGPGDEVIIPAPYWVSYPEMVRLAGGEPVIVETRAEDGMKMTPEQLEKALTPRTKIVLINSPSNPTGMVYTEEELRALGEVALRSNAYILSDEIYEKLLYGDARHVSIAALSDELYHRTITVNGVSKAYCMTGWRIGYSAGPAEIIKGMATVQSQETSNPTSIAQKAALAALNGPQEFLGLMIAEFDVRRRYMVKRLRAMKGVSCIEPEGAFYVFPDVSAWYGKSFKGHVIMGSVDMCDYLLNESRIAVVPGAGFGADAHIRLSYAISMKSIETALDRLEEGLAALS